jgi:hypothetical protein
MNGAPELRYLWAYSAADEWMSNWYIRRARQKREAGCDVVPFCVTPPELKRRWYPFPVLDHMWRAGDRRLMGMYERLVAALEDRDVLVLSNGSNLHPEFVRQIRQFKVYGFGDPESFDVAGKTLSEHYDLVLVNQFSEIARYKAIGRENVFFWPLGSLTFPEDVNDLTEDSILNRELRPVPVSIVCGCSPWREDRMDRLAKEFPEAQMYGSGCRQGIIEWDDMWQLYRRSQIGWNIHNTTGFNLRTFDLPSYGVMEICDNKSDLAKLFEVDREVVGFNSIEECIDLTRYYMSHVDEQRQIALAGWKRWRRDYTPEKVWDRLVDLVERFYARQDRDRAEARPKLTITLATGGWISRIAHKIILFTVRVWRFCCAIPWMLKQNR